MLEAETYWSGTGKRVFNAFIQGRQVLTNFDIFAAAGGANIPITRVFTNAVTNSQLQILFTPVVDNARVSGVQVRKIADVFSDTDGIPDWWRLAYFGHALGRASDNSRGYGRRGRRRGFEPDRIFGGNGSAESGFRPDFSGFQHHANLGERFQCSNQLFDHDQLELPASMSQYA